MTANPTVLTAKFWRDRERAEPDCAFDADGSFRR